MEGSLIKKSTMGAFWQLFGGGWQTVIRLFASFFLARILTPGDFGLFGLALLSQEFIAYIGAIGMNAGLIAKKSALDEDYCTFFWCTTSVRLIMYMISFFSAPVFSILFNEPRLTSLLRVSSLVFLITIFETVPQTKLYKGINFKIMNLSKSISVTIESFLAIIFVIFLDLSYWGLCYAMVISSLFYSLFIFLYVGWRPRLVFSKRSFSYLYKYGINGLGYSIVSYFNNNIDYFLIGRFLGTEKLGLYEYAYKIPHMIYARVAQPISVVIFPSLSEIQDDSNAVASYFESTLVCVSVVIFPMLFGLASIADILVPVFWGAQWGAIVIPLQILCLSSILKCIPQGIGAVFHCKGRPDIIFKISVLGVFWSFLWVGFLAYFFGVTGVAVGMVLSTFPSYLNLMIAYKMLGKSILRPFRKILPILIVSSLSSFSIIILRYFLFDDLFNNSFVILLSVLIFIFVYFFFYRFLFRRLYDEIIHFVETFLPFRVPSVFHL